MRRKKNYELSKILNIILRQFLMDDPNKLRTYIARAYVRESDRDYYLARKILKITIVYHYICIMENKDERGGINEVQKNKENTDKFLKNHVSS